ncbi:MAG: hypothetical protein JWM16_6047 [Verrucomicrobiales bacterium]|nr:hypothetical protein [Verrucomicrobiales bacterium]
MKMELLEDLYVDELKDLYDAEKRLSRTLLRMSKAATAEDLKMAFSFHRKQTKEQIRRLESIFKRLGQSGGGKKCKAMAGLSAEARDLVSEDAEPEVLDAGLITAAQKMEHYEIAGYGSTAAYAKLLGFQEDAALLHQTLVEEKATDEKLNLLARNINIDAAEGEIPVKTA